MNFVNKRVREFHDVSETMLNEEIIPLYQPSVLKGAIKKWEILDFARQSDESIYKYLLESISVDNKVETFVAPKNIAGRYFFNNALSGFNFKSLEESFSQALERVYNYGKNKSLNMTAYAGSIDLSNYMHGFRKLNSMNLVPNSVSPKIWVGNSAQVSTHFDEPDNIACLVSGKREFVLFPIDQINNLYVAPFDKTIANVPVSMVDIDNPDFDKHPRYREALKHAQVATLEPGDALFIPNLWWHQVKSKGDFCVLVNYWWNSDETKLESPMETLIHGLYSISNLRPKERAAWKALFDYLVFHEGGEPLAHLAEEDKGIFKKITPDHAYDLRDLMLRRMGFNLKHVVRGKYSSDI